MRPDQTKPDQTRPCFRTCPYAEPKQNVRDNVDDEYIYQYNYLRVLSHFRGGGGLSTSMTRIAMLAGVYTPDRASQV